MEVYRRLYKRYGPQGWWPGEGSFEIIAGAILTQNVAWANAQRALARMRGAGVWSFQAIRDIDEEQLAELVRPSGYFRSKARKLKAMATYMAGYQDDATRWRNREVKGLREELLTVHGIGQETADDILLFAAGLPSFVIDAYTRRIVDRLGLAPERKSYRGYQELFEVVLPLQSALFNEYHALLDAHAAQTCLKRAPRCADCCLLELCPTGYVGVG